MPKKKKQEVKMDEQEAQQILQASQQKKRMAFAAEYEELCRKHGMKIQPQVQLVVVEIPK